jgi:hypothetical protein
MFLAQGIGAGVGLAVHAPRGRAGRAAEVHPTAPAEISLSRGLIGHAEVDDVAGGCKDGREGAGPLPSVDSASSNCHWLPHFNIPGSVVRRCIYYSTSASYTTGLHRALSLLATCVFV